MESVMAKRLKRQAVPSEMLSKEFRKPPIKYPYKKESL